jgi:hypothetical protein
VKNGLNPFTASLWRLKQEDYAAGSLAAGLRGSQQPPFFIHHDTGEGTAPVVKAADELRTKVGATIPPEGDVDWRPFFPAIPKRLAYTRKDWRTCIDQKMCGPVVCLSKHFLSNRILHWVTLPWPKRGSY